MGLGVGQLVLFGGEPLVFVRIGERCRLELADLEAHEVEFSSARPFVASELCKLRFDVREIAFRVQERGELDGSELVEGVALHRRRQQRLVFVLAVEIDQASPPLCQRRGGSDATVHIGA